MLKITPDPPETDDLYARVNATPRKPSHTFVVAPDLDTETLYHGVASRLWADQLAGDYPIGKADFANPETISWPTHTDDEVYIHTVEELLDYAQSHSDSDDVWLDDEFVGRPLKGPK